MFRISSNICHCVTLLRSINKSSAVTTTIGRLSQNLLLAAGVGAENLKQQQEARVSESLCKKTKTILTYCCCCCGCLPLPL